MNKKLSLIFISAFMIACHTLFAQAAYKPKTAVQLKSVLMKNYSLPTDAKVILVGNIKNDAENNYQVAQVIRYWSMPYSKIKHPRYDLVVFEEDSVIGCYSHFIEEKPLVKNNKLTFAKIAADKGNEIDFSEGVPLMAKIAGEIYNFEPVDFTKAAYE